LPAGALAKAGLQARSPRATAGRPPPPNARFARGFGWQAASGEHHAEVTRRSLGEGGPSDTVIGSYGSQAKRLPWVLAGIIGIPVLLYRLATAYFVFVPSVEDYEHRTAFDPAGWRDRSLDADPLWPNRRAQFQPTSHTQSANARSATSRFFQPLYVVP
jgi:hypothetical protein